MKAKVRSKLHELFAVRSKSRKTFFAFLLAGLVISVIAPLHFLFSNAYTTNRIPMEAHETQRSSFGPILIQPGKTETISISFLNTGTRTWYKDGAQRVAINTAIPVGRGSIFNHSSWTAPYRPAKLPKNEIKPGQVASFSMTIQAPQQTGEYIEYFSLVGLPDGEISGGDFALYVVVGNTLPQKPLFRGKIVGTSPNISEHFTPGETKTFWVDYLNTGRSAWYNPGRFSIALETINPRLRQGNFASNWKTLSHPGYLESGTVLPGKTGRVYFTLQAPNTVDKFAEAFQLVAKGVAPVAGTAKKFTFNVAKAAKATYVMKEPMVRVGITSLNSGVELKGTTKIAFKTTKGDKIAVTNPGEISTITYSKGTYTLTTPRGKQTSNGPIRAVPRDSGVISVLNYRTYYDTFRGVIEINYATATNKLWVINELPMEQYMAGLAEGVNGQHPEYMKSLVVAARSYALWHYFVSSRHKTENYTINSTTDQVYKGYYYELKCTDCVAAVKATRGIIMTHPSAGFAKNPLNIALGAYSSGTDGRTRGFTEVWGGRPEDWEWMVSVSDPYGIIADAKTRPGNHMVGMSANGALGYAKREGRTYDWILKHYYTGISLQTFYK